MRDPETSLSFELPDPQKIDVVANIEALFELDGKVANASPALLPLKSPKELQDFLIKDHNSSTYILQDKSGRWVGCLSLIDLPDDSLEILNVGVDPDQQGKGYGKHMIAFSEQLASELGKHKVTLVTSKKNNQAVNFYEGIGYAIIGEAENYYNDGEARYIFEKSLT
jgi:ribosomal protein S18 acetylase RimI-like enzyme